MQRKEGLESPFGGLISASGRGYLRQRRDMPRKELPWERRNSLRRQPDGRRFGREAPREPVQADSARSSRHGTHQGTDRRYRETKESGQDRPITQVTRKKYEEEEISRFSSERKIDEAILRVVQLAMLMAAIEDDADDELKDAVVSGRNP